MRRQQLARRHGVGAVRLAEPALVDHVRVQIDEVTAPLVPPQVRHQVGGDDSRELTGRLDEQGAQAGDGRLEGMEAPLWLDHDRVGQFARERVGEQAAVLGPGTVESCRGPLAPGFDELAAGLAHDERVGERSAHAAALVCDVGLAPDHGRCAPAALGDRREKERVDVRVEAPVTREHVEPDEVGVMGVGELLRERVVGEAADKGDRGDAVQLHARADQIPVEAVGEAVAVDVELVGSHPLQARRQREVVDEVKRLVTWVEPVDEVREARDGCRCAGHSHEGASLRGGAPAADRSALAGGGPADRGARAGGGGAQPPGGAAVAADRAPRPRSGGKRGVVVLVSPIVPALGGNGLAMRAGMVLEALAGGFDVDLVVVGVSGPLADTGWARATARTLVALEPVADAAGAREHLTRQLADPLLRDRLGRSAPLPQRARLAPPTLAAEAIAGLGERARAPLALFALRGYLAPLGLTLGRELGAGRVVVDLDDDDETFERAAGSAEEADAIARLACAWLPEADVVCAAAAHEAEAIASRYGLAALAVLPNAVRPPALTVPAPGAGRLLFVGNLTYPPNLEAARVLAHEILPVVRETHPEATVDLVGRHDGAISASPHVRVAGPVGDLAPWYAGADLVVAPLSRGGGTRIKLLEAFAFRRAVVATPAAVCGLDVSDGREVAIGRSPRELAELAGSLLADPARAAAIAEVAAATLSAHYTQEVVAPRVRALAGGETGAGGGGRP